ncbi:MAG TPA: class I SAM-dependent methyltransferase [Alphaproteobacteria bacterium]|jgi:uncharacterized membrane protein YkvA (DUF1232 family)|nr:class I SAM-dependent methyltransferase [Alphaproteobacteria bacterium]
MKAVLQGLSAWSLRMAVRVERWLCLLMLTSRDRRLPWFTRALAAIGVVYFFAPFDLIPDSVPVFGWLDDAGILGLGALVAAKSIPSHIVSDYSARIDALSDNGARLFPLAAAFDGAASGGASEPLHKVYSFSRMIAQVLAGILAAELLLQFLFDSSLSVLVDRRLILLAAGALVLVAGIMLVEFALVPAAGTSARAASRKRRIPRRRLSFSERLFNRFALKYYSRNLLLDLQLEAKRSSVEYIQHKMRRAMLMPDRWALLEYALAFAPEDGLVLEFGVEKGASINLLATRTRRTVHGFDSFEGLPEDWHGTFEKRGKFSLKGKLPKVEPNVKLHVGWFSDSLAEFLDETTGPAAFVHVDCDIYSSTKTVFDLLADRIAPGTVIVFDEYFNYPNWQEHEFRAFQEFVEARGVAYEYIGLTAKNGHVAVRITGR